MKKIKYFGVKRNAFLLAALFLFFSPLYLYAQRISYSQPERDDYRNTEFEIIGKIGVNILVFKNNKNNYAISSYDDDMDPQKRVPLDFLPDKVISVDFVPYSDHFQMIYQYQRKRFVYCYGVTMDANAVRMGQMVLIDSSEVGSQEVKSPVYTVVPAEDKSKIMVYKINQDKNYDNVFYTFLMDKDLNLINNSRLTLPMESKKNYLSNFLLTNEGYLVFDKLVRAGSSDFLNGALLVIKPPAADSFQVHPVNLQQLYLDEIKIKLDNESKKIYMTSFYYKQKRGNVEGIYFGDYDWGKGQFDSQRFIPFDDDLKMSARDQSTVNSAFNNYFIRQLIVKQSGGFVVTAEAFFTTSRYSPWNRWDYMNGPFGMSPYYSPYYFYSPFYSPWYYSPYYWNSNRGVRYHYNNVAILSYDGKGKLEWSNFVRKEQYDDDNASFLSYQLVNIGSSLHFLYNEPYRSSYILADESITPDGRLTREPTLRNLDRGYQWMPRYGKQISARQVVIPCVFRSYICFAKIDF
ncbi:MAG TPA: hypothetical protein VIU45_07880 [Chitinophagaceae bacterium]